MKNTAGLPFYRATGMFFYSVRKELIIMLAAFLLSSCAPADGLLPFSVCLSGIKVKPKQSVFLAVGSLLAALTREFSVFSLAVYCIPIMLYLFFVQFLRVKERFTLFWRSAALVICGVIGLLCCPKLLLYDIIMALLSIAAGCAVLPILDGALQAASLSRKKTALTRSEIICLFAMASAAVLSIPNKDLLGINTVQSAILLVAGLMAVSMPDGLATAFTGICAVMLAVKRESPEILITLIVCSVLAGGLKSMGRFSAVTGFLLGDLLMSVCFRQSGLILSLQTVLLGSAAVLLLNKRRLYDLKGLGGSIMVATASEKRLASRSIAHNAQKLKRNAAVFESLCNIFRESTVSKRQRRAELCAGAASRICSVCDQYDYCWKMRYSDTYSDFKELAGLITVAGSISPYDVSDEFKSRCKDWIGVLLDMNNANAAPEKSLPDQGNAIMARQCRSIADMLYSMAEDTGQAVFDHEAEERISDVLCRNGFIAKDVVCAQGDGLSITLALKGCNGDKPCLKFLPRLLKEATGIPLVLNSRNCNLPGGGCSCCFEPRPALKAVCHAACKVKDGQSVCGDSFSLLELPGGKYLAAISDGMGSGAEAARESENAMALLETVFMGQMEPNVAYQTVNELLQLRKKNSESFSTLDALVIDLFNGICSWGKIGAAPGYVMRSGRVQAVQGNSLPLGVVSKINPSISQRTVKAGDVLVLVSDGVYDALVDMHNDGISDFLPTVKDDDAKHIAAELVRQALKKRGGNAMDDMTAIAIRICLSAS